MVWNKPISIRKNVKCWQYPLRFITRLVIEWAPSTYFNFYCTTSWHERLWWIPGRFSESWFSLRQCTDYLIKVFNNSQFMRLNLRTVRINSLEYSYNNLGWATEFYRNKRSTVLVFPLFQLFLSTVSNKKYFRFCSLFLKSKMEKK